MQTRFANLHFLLYDFCGVIAIIGSLIIVVFLVLKVITILVDRVMRVRVQSRLLEIVLQLITMPFAVAFSSTLLTFWALIFTSFMVGMIKDVGLGLKILGYGCAAYLGVGCIIIVLALFSL